MARGVPKQHTQNVLVASSSPEGSAEAAGPARSQSPSTCDLPSLLAALPVGWGRLGEERTLWDKV